MHHGSRAAYRRRAAGEWAAAVTSLEDTVPLRIPEPRAWWWPWLLSAVLVLAITAAVTALWEWGYVAVITATCR